MRGLEKTTKAIVATCVCWMLAGGCGNLPSRSPSLSTHTETPTKEFPSNYDGGFLTNEPCGPPCFEGIRPGESDEKEVARILESFGLHDSCVHSDADEFVGEGLVCRDLIGISYIRGENIVETIGFKPTGLITLGDVISSYGAPDFIIIIKEGRPDQYMMSARVLFNDLFSVLTLPMQEGDIYMVSKSDMVDRIGYAETDAYMGYINRFDDHLRPWVGHGEYTDPGSE